jgi:multidrug resistance efflux pump
MIQVQQITEINPMKFSYLSSAILFWCWGLLPLWAAQNDSESSERPGKSVSVQNAILKTIELTTISSEVKGKILSIAVVEGSRINAGQFLAKVDDRAAQLEFSEAQINLAIAQSKKESDIDVRLEQKRLAVANVEYERAETANMKTPNTYSLKEIDRLRLVAETAELDVERAQHQRELNDFAFQSAYNQLRQVELMLEKFSVVATSRGTVVSVKKNVGEWVEPGQELFQIINIDRLRIEGFIDVSELSLVVEEQAAHVKVRVGEKEHEVSGRLIFISPDANPVNRQVRVHLEIDNPDLLFRPGMRVEAEIR